MWNVSPALKVAGGFPSTSKLIVAWLIWKGRQFPRGLAYLGQIWHLGGTMGQISLLILIPEHDFAIAVLTNSNQGDSVIN